LVDDRASSFSSKRTSVEVQRFNSVILHGSFVAARVGCTGNHFLLIFAILSEPPGVFSGLKIIIIITCRAKQSQSCYRATQSPGKIINENVLRYRGLSPKTSRKSDVILGVCSKLTAGPKQLKARAPSANSLTEET